MNKLSTLSKLAINLYWGASQNMVKKKKLKNDTMQCDFMEADL